MISPRRLLPWLGALVLLLFAAATIDIVRETRALNTEAEQRQDWMLALQRSLHTLQTNHPSAPAVGEALIRIDRIAAEIGSESPHEAVANKLGRASRSLATTLDDPELRTPNRGALLDAGERLSQQLWEDTRDVKERWDRNQAELVFVAVGACSFAGLSLLLGLMAQAQRRRAVALGERLRATLTEAAADRDRAEEASAAKSEFLATMSHELRTPLTAILGMTELLALTEMCPRQRDYLAVIDNGGEALLRLISDVLDLSRIEAGALYLKSEGLALQALLDGTGLLFRGRADLRGLELSLLIEPSCPAKATGDPDRLRQVLFNLVGNAIKFTDVGEVRLRASAVGDELRIEVRDTGPGLPEEARERVFEAFRQLDAGSDRRHGGSGLGLAITRRLVDAMGGRVEIDSEEGRGSCFSVVLPLGGGPPRRPLRAPQQPVLLVGSGLALDAVEAQLRAWRWKVARVVEPALASAACPNPARIISAAGPLAVGGQSAVEVVDFATQVEPDKPLLQRPVRPESIRRSLGPGLIATTSTQVETVDPGGTLVLLVDDNDVNLLVIGGMLERLGCRVHRAANGSQAIDALGETVFDLVFMDCDMPDIDGLEATRIIREELHFETPIVGVSGHATPNARSAALDAGMNDYLPKPLRLADLQGALERWSPGKD